MVPSSESSVGLLLFAAVAVTKVKEILLGPVQAGDGSYHHAAASPVLQSLTVSCCEQWTSTSPIPLESKKFSFKKHWCYQETS